jgi:hypothetical protein
MQDMKRQRLGLCSICNTSLYQDLGERKTEELIPTVFSLPMSTLPDQLAALDPQGKGAFHTLVAAISIKAYGLNLQRLPYSTRKEHSFFKRCLCCLERSTRRIEMFTSHVQYHPNVLSVILHNTMSLKYIYYLCNDISVKLCCK